MLQEETLLVVREDGTDEIYLTPNVFLIRSLEGLYKRKRVHYRHLRARGENRRGSAKTDNQPERCFL